MAAPDNMRKVTVLVTVLSFAVTVTVLLIALASLAVNEPVVDPAGTPTDPGILIDPSLRDSETAVMDVGADERPTVQVVLAPSFRLVLAQVNDVKVGCDGGVTEMFVMPDTEFKVALRVADVTLLTVPACAAKFAEEEAEGTVTEAGTVTTVVLLRRVTTLPPDGAGDERVTVQVLLEPDGTVAGLQDNPEMLIETVRSTVAVFEVEL